MSYAPNRNRITQQEMREAIERSGYLLEQRIKPILEAEGYYTLKKIDRTNISKGKPQDLESNMNYIRHQILKFLYDAMQKNASAYSKARAIVSMLCLTDNEYNSNVSYLVQGSYVDGKKDMRTEHPYRRIRIAKKGIDYVENCPLSAKLGYLADELLELDAKLFNPDYKESQELYRLLREEATRLLNNRHPSQKGKSS